MMEYHQEIEIQSLTRQLMIMRARISKLLQQARQGLDIIQDAKIEVARQAKEIEEQKVKIAKLDHWLETIDNELKESTKQTDVLTEEDIIRYIEIYERYIREYEEYEVILKSITIISVDKSSQSLEGRLKASQQSLVETKNLVIIEIERLRQVLFQMRSAAEIVEEDVSQTDRTIDSTSMPEEIASPRESEIVKEVEKSREEMPIEKKEPCGKVEGEKIELEKVSSEKKSLSEEKEPSKKLLSDKTTSEKKVVIEQIIVKEDKPGITIETQTGQSLMSESPTVTDKSIMCKPEKITTQDVSITCAPPHDIEIQTSDPITDKKEVLENIKIRQTISGDNETIEIESRPVVRDQIVDEQSLLVDANYRDDNHGKGTELNITHSLPQSFETVMVEPDETTTEVVVDADGTKRIIVRKVRRTLVTRQQMVHSHRHTTQMISDGTQDQSFSHINLKEDKGSTSTMLEDGGMQRVTYQQYGGQIISGLPGSEVTIQEFTSRPDMVVKLEEGLNPDEILQLAESDGNAQIQTSSSSVTAVVQQVTKRIVKTKRRIIRRVVYIDGKEHITEEVIDEPDNVEVFEEQIPRVSISVKDQGGVQFEEIDDDHDNDDKPDSSELSQNAKQPREKTPKPDDDENKDNKPANDDMPHKDKSYEPTTMTHKSELSKKFIEMESQRQSQFTQSSENIKQSAVREITPVQSVTISENVPEITQSHELYYVQEPQDGQTTFTSEGYHHSTFETSSSNTATVVQKVTRKITRTRRRIIKHIQIIDGKEHVSEEVINEPDDVEIIEEEPKVSTHTIQEQGVKTKRIKIIRQVQIIDGKEHVTEQIVEEPDDEFVPETTVTTAIDVNIGRIPTVIPEDTEKDIDVPREILSKKSQKTVNEETKKLIDSEILQSSKTVTSDNQTSQISDKVDEITKIVHESKIKAHESIITEPEGKAKEPSEHVFSPVESEKSVQEKKGKKKKGKKNLPNEPVMLPKSQLEQKSDDSKIDSENVKSFKNESCHKISESTDISIVKPVLTESETKEEEPGDNVSRPVSIEITQSKSVTEISSPDRKSKSASPSKRVTFVDKLIESTVPEEVSKNIEPELKRDKISPEPSKFVLEDLQPPQDLQHVSEKITEENKKAEVSNVLDFISNERAHALHPESKRQVKSPKTDEQHLQSIQDMAKIKSESELKLKPESPQLVESEIPHKSKSPILESSKLDETKLKTKSDSTLSLETESQSVQEAIKPVEANLVSEPEVFSSTKTDLLDETKTHKPETEPIKIESTEKEDTIATAQPLERVPVKEEIKSKDKPETKPDIVNLVERGSIELPKDEESVITVTTFDTPQTQRIISTSSIPKLESSTMFINNEIVATVRPEQHQQAQEIKKTDVNEKVSIMADTTDTVAKDTKPAQALLSEKVVKSEEIAESKHDQDNVKQVAESDIKTDDSKVIDLVPDDKQFIHRSDIPITSQVVEETKPVIVDKITELELSETVKLSSQSHINVGEVTKDLLKSEGQSHEPEKPQLPTSDQIKIQNINESVLPDIEKQFNEVKTEVVSVQTPVKLEAAPKQDNALEMPTENINVTAKKSDSKYDNNLLLESERHDTHTREMKPSIGVQSAIAETAIQSTQPQQIVDISMPVPKTDETNQNINENVLPGFDKQFSEVKTEVVSMQTPVKLEATPKVTNTDSEDRALEMPTKNIDATPKKSDSKYDNNLLLESERLDTHSRELKPSVGIQSAVADTVIQTTQPQQTVDISMSLSKTNAKKNEPKVQVRLKVEGFETKHSVIVKKDIDVNLPSSFNVTRDHPKPPVVIETSPKTMVEVSTKEPSPLPTSEEIRVSKEPTPVPEIKAVETEQPSSETPDSLKDHRKSKKKKKHKPTPDESLADSNKSELPMELPTDTDKSLIETDSSSLSHYIELPTSPPLESPKPTEDVLEPKPESLEPDSYVESERAAEEKGYEAEELSQGPTPVPKKRQKKRKPHAISEETTYPKESTAESDNTSLSSPVEIVEPLQEKKGKKKKGKKKLPTEPEVLPELQPEQKPESPKIGSENVESPKDESYRTMSETSDISTVKIVEECVQSSPESLQKEVTTTVTFTVPVVEEIPTQEYSVQTSPELTESIKEDKKELKPESIAIELQTSPIPSTETVVQTTPREEKEADTQTTEEIITVAEKVPVSDTEIQTSRPESPQKVVQSEATTQVVSQDILIPEEKFSQTSSPIEESKDIEKPEVTEIVTESKEMQTSPLPEVQKDEKSTEIIIETAETNIQTSQEIVDQETCTTPVIEKEVTEISIQTPDIPVVSTFTQSDEQQPETTVIESTAPRKPEVVDVCQQTSPRTPELSDDKPSVSEQPVPILDLKNLTMVDSIQQTTPREPEQPKVEIPVTPRPVNLDLVQKDVLTIDSMQQTSPRVYSEDSISTSTDEPYEVHLRAQITIPEVTNDFLDNERLMEAPQSILGDRQKAKKRKHKRKMESPVAQTPESLSDPITTELLMSVTPTSEDYSSKDTSFIDEGIFQLASPVSPDRQENFATHKLTYSDVVQRSKSKSPSPTKSVHFSRKPDKARLLDAIEKRTQVLAESPKIIPDDAMTVAVLDESVEKSYDAVVNKELDSLKDRVRTNDPTRERSVIVVIETISIWLEEIQYKIQRESITKGKAVNETQRLASLQGYIQSLKEIIEITEVNEEIVTLIEMLTRQADAVSTLNSQSPSTVKEVERDWVKFLDDTDKLYQSVEKVKSNLDDIILSDIPTQQKLDKLDQLENVNITNSDGVTKMFRRYRILVETNARRECPTNLYTCDDDTKQMENTINTERDRLLQLSALAEEYEQTLQDFGQITDVAEALLDGKIIVSNLDHLHEEIQKHRKFFVNLSHCRAILESLEDNLDNETRSKYSSLHNSLHDRATAIIDRAAGRAQQMTLAASRWTTLEQSMKEEQQWLRVAQQRIPDLTNVTSIDHEQYINLYQSVSLDVSHHHAKILRLLSITSGLQSLIFCSGLESECSLALDTLLKLQEDVDSRLIRLTAFKENWMTYDFIIERIENWMKIANRELEHITPENITTTGNLRRFWELKAQHEVHNNLKNESGVQFEKALEILPISDEMVQRQFFSKIEDEWRELAGKIDNLHSSAIQSISDRHVSSGEKLNILEDEIRELRASLDSLKAVLRSEDELNLYIERLQVMTGRVDRIQNELGRLSLLPTAESDRLGALLSQSRNLDDQIAEELERSMLLKEKIVLVQAGITRCQKSQRRARLTIEECEAAERLGSDVVERASETCDRLLDDLAAQWRDIRALNQALHTLPTCLRVSVSLTDLERDITGLQETHGQLEAEATELSARLRSKVQLWRRFERQLELVQGAVREADYMAELLTVQGQVDYDRLLKATEKLETLSESLSRRSGELVGELRASAAPLAATTEPAVAARLQRELDDAAAAYEHTCNNLTQLCDKYHKAVDLWKRYRDAAATVRAFAEQQEGTLHALRPGDAPATAQACLEQEERVAELRSLAARVAEETGSRALQADADALARRLQLVAGAVQALADLGEARQLARAKAQHVTEQFSDMRQDLTPLHEDGEIVEDQLIALRQNLIALGKSEADIVPAKEHLPDIDRDVSEEHSIVRILELWQAMFRDTFLHYHRLSTALVRSGDAATALRLWHEYLLDLQSFLSGSVPADYENLTEHRRLCRVHRNLLASQRSVLINEHKETKHRDLVERFDTLTNLHNETLARIVERHDEVSTRIAAWDDYREIYTELLRWLKDMEREKEKLKLRYVHIKRIHKILTKVQNLADKMPEGRKQAEKLSENLKKILEFTEEAYGASVRMEYAGLVKRVDNMHASLDTWRDFLTRILGLIGEYENLTNDLHKVYSKTQDETMSYSDEDRLSRPQLKKAIEKYTDLRTKIDKTETQIEALSVIQEQLKECLSPQDIRIVNQRIWQLRQQRADLEHQLTIIIHRLQERLEVYTIFDSRLLRFAEWLTTLEARLETSSQNSNLGALDPHDLIRRITSDVEAETAMKEREFQWLTETGNVLVDLSKKDEKSFSKTTSKQLSEINGRWHKLQESGRARIAKINDLLETIMQLEERLTEIRLKLHTIESNLTTTVVLQMLTARAVDEKFQERDEIHKNIERVSGEVGEMLNLCQLVFNDPDVLRGNFDLRNLRTGFDIVEKKWKNICDMSEQRKNTLKEIRKSAELANSLLPKVEKKLDSIEKRVEKIETRKQKGETDDESVSKAVLKDLEASEDDVKRLEDAYSRVASARGVELRGEAADSAARLRGAVRRWQQLRMRVGAAGADARRRFVAAHGRAVIALAEADVRLTRALHLAPTPLDKVATLAELMGVEHELVECEALVREADQLAAAAGPGVTEMEAEYRALYDDVRTRLDVARADIVGDVDSAVQVDTLKWETDASLQVDTLTSKETYRVELASAVKEASDCLEALRTALLQQPKEDAGSDELATAAKDIAKAGAKPGQILELAKHLSELLLTECDATEEEAMLKEVESLALRYEDLLAQAKKRELQINNLRLPHSASYALTCEHESGRLTCPLCSERNWKQLDNDLWRLEQWLQFAEAAEEGRQEPPEVYDQLEDAIQDHREFLLNLDSHKSIVVSLNVVGAHVAAHAAAPADAARVRTRLAAANARWDAACAAAGVWQAKLQRALVHNQQFHDIVVELVSSLAAAERGVRTREPLRLNRPAAELQRDFRRFSELHDELSRAEPRVHTLHDTVQLLRAGDAPPSADDICRRLGELRLRLQSLRKLSGVYALKLGAALARQPRGTSALAAVAAAAAPQLMEEEEEQISTLDLPPLDENDVVVTDDEELSRLQRGLRFVCRVARASLPFQALLLILLGAAALAPHASSDCRTPGLALEPVLRYPDGPPPL